MDRLLPTEQGISGKDERPPPAEAQHDEGDLEEFESGEEDGAEGSISALASYLDTERGHAVALRVVDFFESVKSLVLDGQQQDRKLKADLSRMYAQQTFWLKGLGLLVVVGSIVGLSVFDKLTGAAGTVLGAVAGYLFGKGPRSV